jgi:hypothetical protein
VWFCELSAARSGGGSGLNPIGFADISGWAHVTRAAPTPWEVALIRRIDAEILPRLNSGSGRGHNMISADNIAGVDALFDRIEARANRVFG